MIDSDIPDAEIIRLICSHMTDNSRREVGYSLLRVSVASIHSVPWLWNTHRTRKHYDD